jgi:hypothetical protein
MRGVEVEGGRREGLWCVVVAHERHMHGENARLKAWGPRARAERTENMLLMSVTLEVSKLSGWLKADPCRVEGRACDAGERGASREAGGPVGCGGSTQEACTGMAQLKAWGPRARAERTKNMLLMSVTLEVSQPEMSALKFVKPLKRELMSVMAETHQSAMGPYFAMAAVGLALNSWTAACREALVVKTQGGEDGGEGGEGGEDGEGDGGGEKTRGVEAGDGDGGGGEGGEGDGGGGLGDGGEGDGGGGLGDGGAGDGGGGRGDGGEGGGEETTHEPSF